MPKDNKLRETSICILRAIETFGYWQCMLYLIVIFYMIFSLQALGNGENKDHWFMYFLISKLHLY